MSNPNFATIEISLKECLLPSELSSLMSQAQSRNVQPGEVIVLALRDYLAKQAVHPDHERNAALVASVAAL
jgi:hypothetical protein